MPKILPFLFIWLFALSSWGAVGGGGTGGSATNAQPPSTILTNISNTGAITNSSTNSFSQLTNILYSKFLNRGEVVFYDNFDAPDMDYVGIFNRVTPSGHRYRLHANAPAGTNGIGIRSGYLVQTQAEPGAFYLSWSNTASTTVTRPINWWGMLVDVRDTGLASFTFATMIKSLDHTLASGTYLHGPFLGYGEVGVQRALSEDILNVQLGGVNQTNLLAIQCVAVSNTIAVSYAGHTWFATHTNLTPYSTGPVNIWELNGSSTNSYQMRIKAIWAGYADPEIAAALDSETGSFLGTNGVQMQTITRPTLTTNTYISRINDSVIAMPNAASGVTGRTNKLPAVGTIPGKEITIYDEGKTASGTNIWITSIDGNLINRSILWTNITLDAGSLTLISTPFGWQIKGSPASSGSGENNVNGETSVTNSTRMGLVAGKSGVTNLLRSVQGGNGIVTTNQGTNIVFAIDPSVVSSPGGAQPMLQMTLGGAFTGTTNLTYDNTNMAIGLGIAGARPRTRLEIGDTGSGNLTAITVGSTLNGPSTNFISAYSFTSSDAVVFKAKASALATASVDTNSFYPGQTNHTDLGLWELPWRTNHSIVVRAKSSVQVDGVPGASPGFVILPATNQTQQAVVQAAHQMSVNVTNVWGLLHKSSASVIEHNANQFHRLTVTNRLTAATSLILTNTSDGQLLSGVIPGEVSGGTSRTLAFIPNTGQLVACLDDFGTALATSYTITVTNGNAVAYSDEILRVNGTNIHHIVTRQFKH